MKREVNKPAVFVTAVVLGVLVSVFLALGIYERGKDGRIRDGFNHVLGVVTDYGVYEQENSDGDEYETYSATIVYDAENETITVETDVVFRNAPKVGSYVDILYNPANVYEYYIAKADSSGGNFVRVQSNTYAFFLAAALALCFFMCMIAFLLPNDRVCGLLIGMSLILMAVIGIVFTFLLENGRLLLLIPFGIVGSVILWVNLFRSKETSRREVEASQYVRLFFVQDVVYENIRNGSPIVLLVMQERETADTYFSYVDREFRFHSVERCLLDIRLITDRSKKRVVNNMETTDISYIPSAAFKPLSPMLEKASHLFFS